MKSATELDALISSKQFFGLKVRFEFSIVYYTVDLSKQNVLFWAEIN